MSESLKTSVYQTDAHTYMRAIAEMWLGRWWWIMIIPIAVCFGLGATVNVAFAFVGFMVIFLIAPMVVMFLYFAHALTPEARMAIIPHEVELTPENVIITFQPINQDNPHIFPPINLKWTDIISIEWRNHDIMIHLTGTPYRFLLIPYSAMGDKAAQSSFSAFCRHHAKLIIGDMTGIQNDRSSDKAWV